MKRILLIRNDHLGDTILAFPVVPLIRERYPEISLLFMMDPSVAPLGRCVEGIDEILEADQFSSHKQVELLQRKKVEVAVVLRPTWSNAWAVWRAGIPLRIGTSRRFYSLLFNKRVFFSRRQSSLHEVELNVQCLKPLGIEGDPYFPVIHLPDGVLRKVEGRLINAGKRASQRLIVIHPGSKGSSPRWPSLYWRLLVERLSRHPQFFLVITGGREERVLGEYVAGGNALNWAGETDLMELAGLLSLSDLFISSSTGPLHLAVALGREVLGLYPPSLANLPTRWGPYGHPEWVLTAKLPPCPRCYPGDFSPCACMERLSVEEVLLYLLSRFPR